MTPRQKQCLDFIKKFWKENGYSPSFEEIAEGMDLKSKSNVHSLVNGLVARGYVEKQNYLSRSLRVLPH